jgi:hypothetical protein
MRYRSEPDILEEGLEDCPKDSLKGFERRQDI